MKEFDIVVYGASGFTAQHVIRYLQQYPLRIALSARSANKIRTNPSNYPVIQCDVDNIDMVTSKTMVLMNCAGPYVKCGEAIVRSCIENGCHYIDITGETSFIRDIIAKFAGLAMERNIYVVNCCGFDSVPCDIAFDMMKKRILGKVERKKDKDVIGEVSNKLDDKNVSDNLDEEPIDELDKNVSDKLNEQPIDKLNEQPKQVTNDKPIHRPMDKSGNDAGRKEGGSAMMQDVNEEIKNIRIYNFLRLKNVRCNFATFESLIHGLASHFSRPRKRSSTSGRARQPKKIIYSEERKCYCVIFMGTDHSVVTRSQKAFNAINDEQMADFYMYMEVGSLPRLIVFMFFCTLILWMAKFSFSRRLLLRFPRLFTCGRVKYGLTDEEIEKASFEMNFYGYYEVVKTDKEHKISTEQKREHLTVTGPDPGYKTTPICMVECARLMIEKLSRDEKFLLCSGGVVTPAMVYSDTVIARRLNANGINFVFK